MKQIKQPLYTSNPQILSFNSNLINNLNRYLKSEKAKQSTQQLRINNVKIQRNKSFEIINKIEVDSKKERRKSEYEQLSSKQIRFNCLFPASTISYLQQQQQIQEQEQRTKIRRKTLFQKMSSLLIKHQTVLKNFTNAGAQHQKKQAPEEIEQILVKRQTSDSEQLDKTQQRDYQFRTHRYPKKKILTKGQLDKVVLDLTRKSNKPFKTIANYMSIKSASFRDLSESQSPKPKIKIKMKQYNYIQSSNLFELQDLVSSPKSQANKSNLIRSCINLPDVRATSFINSHEKKLPLIYNQPIYKKRVNK